MADSYHVTPAGAVVYSNSLSPEEQAGYHGPMDGASARQMQKLVMSGQAAPTPASERQPAVGSASPAWATRKPAVHDGLAIASLVCSFVWVFGINSIIAIIFAGISMSRAKAENRSASGLAIAGLCIGILGVLGLILFIILIVVAAHEANTLNNCGFNSAGQYTCG